jgi:hypothetical protein
MPQKKPPMPSAWRPSYHEAGHAVAANNFGIAVDRLSLFPAGHASASRFQPLAEFCRLETDRPVDLVKLDQYVVFLMAGAATEIRAVERYHELVAGSPTI